MKGYPCAWENEECKCSGNVVFGIADWNNYIFGKTSEMRYVNNSIDCVERKQLAFTRPMNRNVRKKNPIDSDKLNEFNLSMNR